LASLHKSKHIPSTSPHIDIQDLLHVISTDKVDAIIHATVIRYSILVRTTNAYYNLGLKANFASKKDNQLRGTSLTRIIIFFNTMKKSEINDPTAEKVERMEESSPTYTHKEEKTSGVLDVENRAQGNLNAVFENPLAGIPREQLFKNVVEFCQEYDLMDHVETFKKGALISQDPASATSLPGLLDFEREALEREYTHKWSQPWQLYFLACRCDTAVP
jgi:hypothetical protein